MDTLRNHGKWQAMIMTLTSRAQNAFIAASRQQAAHTGNLPKWLRDIHETGLETFVNVGFPNRKNEEWKYTSLKPITDSEFTLPPCAGHVDPAWLASLMSPAEITLVFVDGFFVPELSTHLDDACRDGLVIQTLGWALEHRAEAVRNLLAQTEALQATSLAPDPFLALNHAFLREGAFVALGRNVQAHRPIHLLHVATQSTAGQVQGAAGACAPALFARHFIVLDECASASVCETYAGASEGVSFSNVATDVRLGAGARLTHTRLQAENHSSFHVNRTRAIVARDAHFETFGFDRGGQLVRNDLDIVLAGQGAHTLLNGLYAVRGSQHVDNHTCVDHTEPNATSSQLYKGILDDKARAVFNGKVCVRQKAQQTAAYQLNKNLLLSNEAEIDTKPQLEIHADDVKCSHGAAIGSLNAEELFYLQARGIPLHEAQVMLSHAFATDVVMRLREPAVKERVGRILETFFPE